MTTVTGPPGLAGVPVPRMEPGTTEWLAHMTASKIAAVVGLSPWESRFSLWHKMAGNVTDPEPGPDDERSRGHYLEAGVAAWFADTHPEWDVRPATTYRSPVHPWMVATPDRLLISKDSTELLEVKTDARGDDWSQGVPAYYQAQAQWQMAVTGTTRVHFAVLGTYLSFEAHTVERSVAEVDRLTRAAAEFMDTLPGRINHQFPPLDDHHATYQTVRELHPDIDPDTVELTEAVADAYCRAQADLKTAKAAEQAARTRVADAMGTAQKATHAGTSIARRQAKGDGVPYVVAARNLPTRITTED